MKYLFPATPLMPEYVTHVFLACWHKKSFEMFCHHWYFDILSKKKKTLHKSSHHILIFSSHMWVGVGGWAKNVFTYFCVLNVPCKKSSPHLSQHVLKGVDGKKNKEMAVACLLCAIHLSTCDLQCIHNKREEKNSFNLRSCLMMFMHTA